MLFFLLVECKTAPRDWTRSKLTRPIGQIFFRVGNKQKLYQSIDAMKRFIAFCDQMFLIASLKNPKIKTIFTHEYVTAQYSNVRGSWAMSSITLAIKPHTSCGLLVQNNDRSTAVLLFLSIFPPVDRNDDQTKKPNRLISICMLAGFGFDQLALS